MISTKKLGSIITAVALLTLIGCAGAKIKNERVALKADAISRTDVILVKEISADKAVFSGDKSGEKDRVDQEKKQIKMMLHDEIANALRKQGFVNAKVYSPGAATANAVIVDGSVTAFEHGSAAGRMFVGMGAGSSNMFVDLKVTRGKNLLTDLQVVATSGGRGGVFSMGSFMKAHVEDAAKQTAKYFDKHVK